MKKANIIREENEIANTPSFVLNPIIYVDGEESDESSVEEYDDSDKIVFDELGDEISDYPYRTFTIKKSKAKKIEGELVKSKPIGYVEQGSIEDILQEEGDSATVKPFLDKLYEGGLEDQEESKIEDISAVSMALNRPLSLSTRKNNILKKELKSYTVDHIIQHNKFGIFWKFKWYDVNNKVVKYDDVRSFYKKLKSHDKENGTNKADFFRAEYEKNIAVPYQELRELAKNHQNTKDLVFMLREQNPNSDVYLSFVDGDTISFNGIYSAYLRIHNNANIIPTIMSTCYEFTEETEGELPFVEGSKLCRKIRVATAKHVKLGVYVPEPNFCALVLPNEPTILESFIDKSIKNKNAESAALLRNLINSRKLENMHVIISEDNPLLTTIPERVRYTKSKKTKIEFSEGFKSGLGATEKDIQLFKQMSQSHVHEGVWIDNLYINRAITLKKGMHFKFKGLLTNHLKDIITDDDLKILHTIISDEDLRNIKLAFDEKEQAIQVYREQNIRNESQGALIDYISKLENVKVDDFEKDFLQIIVNADIIELLEDEILDLSNLAEYTNSELEIILYNLDAIELLHEEEIDWQDLVNIYNIAQKYGDDFNDALNNLIRAKDDYDITEIIEKYDENPLHLMFMAADTPEDVILEHFDDIDIVRFAIENDYDCDIDWIKSELENERDEMTADAMLFDAVLLNIFEENDCYVDDSDNEYYDY